MHWRRKWQPTPLFLPGESQGWGSLVGCRLWGCTESDTTEATWQHMFHMYNAVVVQLLSRVWLFATPWTAACQDFLSFTVSQSLLRFISIESVMPSSHLILSSPSPPAFNLSQDQGLFQWVSSSHQMAKVVALQLQHQSFQRIFKADFSFFL